MGLLQNAWDYVTEDVVKGTLVGVGAGAEGAAGFGTMVVGGGIAAVGYVADPVVNAVGNAIVSGIELVDTKNIVASDDEYEELHEEFSWPGWGGGHLVTAGEDIATEGVNMSAQSAAGFYDAGVYLAPGGERDPTNRATVSARLDEAQNTSAGAKLVGELFSPNKLGIAINIAGLAIGNSTDWLAERNAIDVNQDITQEEYDRILIKEKAKYLEETKQAEKLLQIQDQLNRSSNMAIDASQALAYSQVLAGPQGFGAPPWNDYSMGISAITAYQSGDFAKVAELYNKWKGEGGTWIAGQNFA